LDAFASQFPKFVAHVKPHALDTHVAVALARAGQTMAQPPQLLTLLVMLVSQPLVRLLESQSAKPTTQLPVQLPPEQATAMLLLEHAELVQPPHWVIDVLVSTSQPLLCRLPSQLARPAAQTPLQTLDPQVREASPFPEQTALAPEQAPQASGSDVRLRQTPKQLV